VGGGEKWWQHNCWLTVQTLYAIFILTPERISQGHVQSRRQATFSWPTLWFLALGRFIVPSKHLVLLIQWYGTTSKETNLWQLYYKNLESCTHTDSCNGHALVQSSCNDHVLVQSSCNGHALVQSSCNGHVLVQSSCNGRVLVQSSCNGHVFVQSSCVTDV
jgi:hypothetical protein